MLFRTISSNYIIQNQTVIYKTRKPILKLMLGRSTSGGSAQLSSTLIQLLVVTSLYYRALIEWFAALQLRVAVYFSYQSSINSMSDKIH